MGLGRKKKKKEREGQSVSNILMSCHLPRVTSRGKKGVRETDTAAQRDRYL